MPQKRLHKLEQIYKQPLDIRPTFLTITSQHFWHEAPVTNQLQPGKTEEKFHMRTKLYSKTTQGVWINIKLNKEYKQQKYMVVDELLVSGAIVKDNYYLQIMHKKINQKEFQRIL